MATINANLQSLQDVMSQLDASGRLMPVVEILSQENHLLNDGVWVEANEVTGHRVNLRKSLPTGTWRRYNEGVTPQKGRVDSFVETPGMLDAMSKVDCALAKVGGQEAAYRAAQDRPFIQGLSNDLETALFYSSAKTTPEQIHGLSPRLDSTTGTWGGQIVDSQIAASGNDQASMWLVVWGEDTCHFIYPKGQKAGLDFKDCGMQLTRDANNAEFLAWVSYWSWNIGLAIPDARSVVRLANIDTSAIAETGKLLIQDMVKMVHQCKVKGKGRARIYCNPKLSTYLHLQALDATTNSTLTIQNIGGEPVTTFLGIPIRETEALTNTESIVS